MVNKVQGRGLGTKQTVRTETVLSKDIKDRRRFNDDSKHMDKVEKERQKLARQQKANKELANHPQQNPYNHFEKARSLYTAPSYANLIANEGHARGWPSSTPDEKLEPMALHTHSEKHD